MRFIENEKSKSIRRGTFYILLILLCCLFFVRWQSAVTESRRITAAYTMRAEEQLRESAAAVSEAISAYRDGGNAREARAALLRAEITGKEAVSYLKTDPSVTRTLQCFFADAGRILADDTENAVLDRVEAYAVSLNRYLYRARDGASLPEGTDYSGLPFYPEQSDAVEAEKRAELPESVLIDQKDALAAARKYLGGHITLKDAETNDESVYVFYCQNACVVLRKTDGRLLRLIMEHRSGTAKKSAEEMTAVAEEFLKKSDITGYRQTDAFVRDNVYFLQYTPENGEEPPATVGVALNTGTVCAFFTAP